ncbi:MAG: hypothetical protein ACRD0D_04135, partial [Acidimicrobiales bacterium]
MTTTALIGTAKGLSVFAGERGGGRFTRRGPLFPGEHVDGALIDTAGSPASDLVRRYDELPLGPHDPPLGRRRRHLDRAARGSLAFPDAAGASVVRVWQLAPGPAGAGWSRRRSQQRRRPDLSARGWTVEPPGPHAVVPRLCLPTILVDPRDPARSWSPSPPAGCT